jgi:hypothetical protein
MAETHGLGLQSVEGIRFRVKPGVNMTTPSEILDAAMGLDDGQRAEVAHQLLLSLEPHDFDEDADSAWAAEIRRRLHAIREGRVILRDWDEALAKIRQSLVSKANS